MNPTTEDAATSSGDEKTRLLEEARRRRRLAAAITDPEVIKRLTALAEEYERRADASSGTKDGKD